MKYLHFANLTGPQTRVLTFFGSAIIWALIFIAGYEWANLLDWLTTGGSIYD